MANNGEIMFFENTLHHYKYYFNFEKSFVCYMQKT